MSALRFNRTGGLLASGGRDTDCIIWDVVAETGLFRLKGHKDEVTGVVFCEQGHHQWLVTCSKDSHVRVWDLATQHCVQTVVGHRCEVWSLDIDPLERLLVTGAADAQLRVFRIANADQKTATADSAAPASGHDDVLVPCGAPLARPGPDRAVAVRFSPNGGMLAVLSAGRLLELWNAHSDGEARRRARRRQKRKRDKQTAGTGNQAEPVVEASHVEVVASDMMTLHRTVPLKSRALALSWCPKPPAGVSASFAVTLASNTVELYDLAEPAPDATALDVPPEPQRVADVSQPGHRADVRAVALSSDDSLLISTSHAGAKVRFLLALFYRSLFPVTALITPGGAGGKSANGCHRLHSMGATSTRGSVSPPPSNSWVTVNCAGRAAVPGGDILAVACSRIDRRPTTMLVQVWNPGTGICLRTIPCGYGLCCVFAPGARYALVGTKAGTVDIVDVAAAQLARSIAAHDGAVWSITLQPDGDGFVTGGSDKEVKFWDFCMEAPAGDEESRQHVEQNDVKTLSARHMRTLRLTDDVLSCRFSPDGKYLAVALLDATVKVFFSESLKFFVSLFGHKLPCLCCDISSDGALIATGSADKNVKLWGLDFGDCHASIRAHDDSVTCLAFVPRTHYLFTCSKDRTLKYWDADKRELLLRLFGHSGEVWGLAVSSDGGFVVTAGHDRSLRRWKRTDEPFFVEEERERRLESLFEAGLEDAPDRQAATEAKDDEPPGEGMSTLAGRRSMATLSATESVVDALEIAAAEVARLEAHNAEEEQVRG